MPGKLLRAAIVLALTLSLLAAAPALGEARYPAQVGMVTDEANALSQTTVKDMDTYASRAENAAGLKIHVALVYFLDGETPQAYADELFSRWELGEDDLLLLGAAAEDTFAFSEGENVSAKLSAGSLSGLAYSSGFADAFASQRYDAAMNALFPSLNGLINKQYDTQIALGSLFGTQQAAAEDTVGSQVQSVVDSAYSLWTGTLNAITNKTHAHESKQPSGNRDGGVSTGGWIVLALLALLILGQGRSFRRSGCGCSPLGWIVGGLGLGALFGRRRERDSRRERRFEREFRRR